MTNPLLPFPTLTQNDPQSLMNAINQIARVRLIDINNAVSGATAGNVSALASWTAYTPVWSSDGGAFGGLSSSGRYLTMGKTMFYEVSGSITSVGIASGTAYFTLPIGTSASAVIGNGKDVGLTGKALSGQINNGSTQVAVQFYDGSSPIAKNALLVLNGIYETA